MSSASVNERHPLFPSGEWEGFYTYSQGPAAMRHPMRFNLEFTANSVCGSGGDDIGPFFWNGQYAVEELQCRMTKHYITHTVSYDGKVDENGIWGTWELKSFRGGFHIWPRKCEMNTEVAERELQINVNI